MFIQYKYHCITNKVQNSSTCTFITTAQKQIQKRKPDHGDNTRAIQPYSPLHPCPLENNPCLFTKKHVHLSSLKECLCSLNGVINF